VKTESNKMYFWRKPVHNF